MPDYDYECEKCGHVFEITQKMSDKPLSTCPECKGPLKRLFGGGSGVIVKGGSSSVPCGKDSPCCGPNSPCMRK